MSRRDAAAAGQRSRHARARLQATLGGVADGDCGLLASGGPPGGSGFEYRGSDAASPGPGTTDREDGGRPSSAAGSGPSLRWRVGLRVALAVGALAVAAGAVFWWQTASGQPEILPLNTMSRGSASPDADPAPVTEPGTGDSAGQASADPGAAGGRPGTSGSVLVVHVSGAVKSPGVVTLPAGSRVHQAITAAGGAADDADLDLLNLALVAEDGQKIHVPRRGEQIPPGDPLQGPGGSVADGSSGPGAGSTSAGAKVNINTAGVEEDDALPKVGPVLAQRIVDWRKEHGAFSTVEELDAVDGVGPKMLETLLPLVTV